MNQFISEHIIQPFKKTECLWRRKDRHGVCRVSFSAAVSLIKCGLLLDSPIKGYEESKLKPEEVMALLPTDMNDGNELRQLDALFTEKGGLRGQFGKPFYLNSAQQRIASGLDRCVNYKLERSGRFYEDRHLGEGEESALLHLPPGIRLWLLSQPSDRTDNTQLFRIAHAFNKCSSSGSTATVKKIICKVCIPYPSRTPKMICAKILQEYPKEEGLSFVVARVNMHKHRPSGTTPKTRAFLVEWCLTAAAFHCLMDLYLLLLND